MGKARIEGVDDFLNSGGDRTRGKYLSGWKKDGKVTVWLHQKVWCAKSWNHGIPCVQEFKDKETDDKKMVVWTERWGCHETEALLLARYDRDRTGGRSLPPVVCPSCIFAEVVRELVQKGAISWTDVLFLWDGDADDDRHEVMAGGIYNAFNSKDVNNDKAKIRELRAAGVKRTESWSQSQLVRMQWLFCLASASALGDGIMKTFESKGLGEKMKNAIKDEMRRASPRTELGDPLKNPYPFEWTYDENGLFDDKYKVLALTNEKPSPEVLALIGGPAPDIDNDVLPGNCWWLKNELTSHYVGKFDFPWDRVFGPAEAAGLMAPPASDTKSDASEDEDGEPPDVGRGAEQPSRPGATVYVVGADHDVWFEDAKIDPKVKGASIELVIPEKTDDSEAASDEAIALVVAQLKEWGAVEVAYVVQCDHCLGRITTLDVDCPHCGAEFDDDGAITSRPCLVNKEHHVAIEGDGPAYICGTCAAIHELAPETDDRTGLARWTVKPQKAEAKKEEAPTRRRRLEPTKEPAKEPTPPPPAARVRKGSGVPFDMAKGGQTK